MSEALSIGKKVGLGVTRPRVMEDEYMEGWVPGSLISSGWQPGEFRRSGCRRVMEVLEVQWVEGRLLEFFWSLGS